MRRALLAVLVVGLLLPAASEAAFPGANGKIAFVRAGDIWTMNPDGTGQVNLTNSAAVESDPAWSPDGNRIAFGKRTGTGQNYASEVYVMFADGTGVTPVTNSGVGLDPAWSPDGDRLVYFTHDQGSIPALARIDVDGSNYTVMYYGGDDKYDSEWSPDGSTIAFHDYACNPGYNIYTIEADATWPAGDPFNLTNCDGPVDGSDNFAIDPNWSPDGQKIVFHFSCLFHCPSRSLQTIRPDGTDRQTIATGQNFYAPAWSPDGSKIAYSTGWSTPRINVINANGTGNVDLTDGDAPDWQPLNQAGPEADVLSTITDSPDPVRAGGILTYTAQAKNLVGPDPASGVTLTVNLPASVFFVSATPSQGSCSQASGTVTCNFGNLAEGASATVTIQVEPQTQGPITATANASATEPDPVPGNNASQTTTTVSPGGYARPKGASPIRASLVPAFRACDPGQATLTHGAPLASPSCASPALTSGHLTLGTSSNGYVRLLPTGEVPIDPNNGDQADVTYDLQLTDVRKASDLTDYTGELQVQATLRLTDKHSSPSGKAPATMSETSISFDAPCTATPTAVGSTCSVSTSADAVVPGIAQELRRAVWDLGKVRVLDGGADGDAQTGPNTLFAVQGVFVP